MNQWFEKPVDAKPWTFDQRVVEQAARRGRGIGNAISICILTTIAVFLIGMAFTNRDDLPRFYPNCGWARLVGAAPVSRSEKGYRQALDSDNDGFACELFQDR